MASIFKVKLPSGKERWELWVRRPGQGKPIRKRFKTEDAAKKEGRRIEQIIDSGKVYQKPEGERRTLKDAVKKYVKEVLPDRARGSYQTEKVRLEWWAALLGDHFLARITPGMIHDGVVKLRQEGPGDDRGRRRALEGGVSETTARHYLKSLNVLFNEAMKTWEWISTNPVERVKRPKAAPWRVRYLTDEEEAALLDACRASANRQLYPLVLLLLRTGARAGEIMRLKWRQVDIKAEKIHLQAEDVKSGRARDLELIPEVMEVLDRYRTEQEVRAMDGWVFPAAGKPDKPAWFPRKAWVIAIQQAISELRKVGYAVRKEGLADFHPHDCRHHFASHLIMNGVDILSVSQLLGHGEIGTTERYSHLRPCFAAIQARKVLISNGKD